MLKNNTVVIGLTGMSGAGKSTACGVFREYGFDIIDCDRLSREVVAKNHPCLREIAESFPDGIIDENGELDRKKMAEIIFSDDKKRRLLNSIMYPYISYIVIENLMSYSGTERRYVVLDAPTLFESGINTVCDLVVSIIADESVLIERIMKRDKIGEVLARQRLGSQMKRKFYEENSDFCANNCRGVNEFIDKIKTIADKILKFGD